jgi:hypothetical protein
MFLENKKNIFHPSLSSGSALRLHPNLRHQQLHTTDVVLRGAGLFEALWAKM